MHTQEMVAVKTAPKQQHKVIGRPFKQGQSGNPKGRPKGSFSFVSILKQQLNTYDTKERKLRGEILADRIIQKAMDGDTRLMIELVHLIDGKPDKQRQSDAPSLSLHDVMTQIVDEEDDDDYGYEG